jgi:hypothetical protein
MPAITRRADVGWEVAHVRFVPANRRHRQFAGLISGRLFANTGEETCLFGVPDT